MWTKISFYEILFFKLLASCLFFSVSTYFIVFSWQESIKLMRGAGSVADTTLPISQLVNEKLAPQLNLKRAELVIAEKKLHPWLPVKNCPRDVPKATENLPRGMIVTQSDLYPRRIDGEFEKDLPELVPKNLLAMVVGSKQRTNVNLTVSKFPADNFSIILFHYDGDVNSWNEFHWNDRATHVSVKGQGKWWYAKRFLHPDVVAPYNWLFFWDEDLGVENFDPLLYMKIIEEEGLEISQPALDPEISSVHHKYTVRRENMKVHRRHIRKKGKWPCNFTTNGPPCSGWVEVMAPVFSKHSWRCFWHLIQNDLVHGWALDNKLGYCTKKDRAEAVGVVDQTFISHKDLKTLLKPEKTPQKGPGMNEVHLRAYNESLAFRFRWHKAVWEDKCWIDPYIGEYRNVITDPPPPPSP